jgi:hypothetical protein
MNAEETKKAADELVESYWTEVEEIVNDECIKMTFNMAVQCAIASTENTINVLRKISNEMYEDSGYTQNMVNPFINQQAKLLNELKTRL